jgi:hypothetical protein
MLLTLANVFPDLPPAACPDAPMPTGNAAVAPDFFPAFLDGAWVMDFFSPDPN